MGRAVEEVKGKNGRRNGTNGHNSAAKRFISFHPTKEEKIFIRQMEESLEDCLVGLRPWLASGCKVTIGFSSKNDACYASIREHNDNWRNARALSAWHADPDTALRSLCFAVVSRYPSFPELDFNQEEYDLDW